MQTSHRNERRWRALAVSACLLLATNARADLDVPAGGSLSLDGGSMDLGCTDVIVGGNLLLESGVVTGVQDVSIQAGTPPDGTLDGGSGSITLAGSWSNGGTFAAGTSSVAFIDDVGCAPSSAITGNTAFHDLSLVSTLGKVYTIAPGTTQAVGNALTVLGTLSHPIQITSGVPGSPGFLNLAPGGSQNIAHVGVSSNWATGQPLAPLLTNEGGAGDSRGWFGLPLLARSSVAVPTLGSWGVGLLALFLAGFGLFFSQRRTRHARTGVIT